MTRLHDFLNLNECAICPLNFPVQMGKNGAEWAALFLTWGRGGFSFFLWQCLLLPLFVIRLIFLFPGSGIVLWRRCGSIWC